MPGPSLSSRSKTARGDPSKQADMDLVTFRPALVLSARTPRHQRGDVVQAWQPETLSQHIEMDEESVPRLEQLQVEFGNPRLFAVWPTLAPC